MKGWWINLALLAILTSAGSGLWWWEEQETTRLASEKTAQALSTLPPDTIKEVHYRTLDKVDITLTRQDETWRITTPKTLDADQGTMTRLLSTLSSSYNRKVTETPNDLTAFGLSDPVTRFTAQDETGKNQTILAGTTAPAGQGRYLRLGETGPVVLAEPAKVASLILEYKELRHKGLAPAGLERDDITKITLERAGETVSLTRQPAQPWSITSPWTDQADSDRVGGWINLLIMAQGVEFKPLPQNAPDWTLTLTTNEPRVIKLWKGDKELLAQRPGEEDAVTLADYLAEDLDKPVTELVFLRPWPVDKTLAKLTITRGDKNQSAAKKDGKWPQEAWGALEEALVREAWKGHLPKGQGEPLFTLTAEGDGTTLAYPFWKEHDSFIVGLAQRPVDLLMTSLLSKSLEESVAALFGEKKPDPQPETKP